MTISAAQAATRRRAFGRKLAKHASDLKITAAGVKGNQDTSLLTEKEDKALARQLEGLDKIATNFSKLGASLEKSE